MKKRIKICFIGGLSQTFIRKDYEILKKHFDVDFIESPKIKSGLLIWVKYIFNTQQKVKNCDITFSWFAGWHSAVTVFFSKLFRKKSIVVVGGYDAAYAPEINYGAFTNFKEKFPAVYIYKKADKILVVNLSLKKGIIANAKVSGENIEYLPTGYDSRYWKLKGKKKNIVLTVARANDIKRVKLKGLDLFAKSAKFVNDTKFIVIGVEANAKRYLEKNSPDNLELIGFFPKEKLIEYYQEAKVYCQLSIREGLPNTLCEAMLCECVPVGTKLCGIQTAMGDIGFYVSYGKPEETAELIKEALRAPDVIGKKARERIKKLFPKEKRERELTEKINSLVSK